MRSQKPFEGVLLFFSNLFCLFPEPRKCVAKSTIYTILWATLPSFSTKLDDENNVMCFQYDMMTNTEQNHNVLFYIGFLFSLMNVCLPFKGRFQQITTHYIEYLFHYNSVEHQFDYNDHICTFGEKKKQTSITHV